MKSLILLTSKKRYGELKFEWETIGKNITEIGGLVEKKVQEWDEDSIKRFEGIEELRGVFLEFVKENEKHKELKDYFSVWE